jgi:hypothetical protein
MLQDFFTGRIATDSSAAPALSRGNAEFQPLTSSRISQLSAPGAASRPAEPARLETPQVEIIEENGKVRRIVVTCTCCEKIEIECEY